MSNLKLTIVTVTYNNFDDLEKTLDSLAPYYNKYEVLVVNGGKCKKTEELLKNIPPIKFVSEPDNGISDAFNKGVRLSSSDAITFLNSGDIIYDDKFYEDALTQLQNVDMVFGDIYYGYQDFGTYIRRVNRDNPLNNFNHQGMVYKKALLEKCPFSDLYPYSMDFDQVLRCIQIEAKYSYSNELSVKMFSHGKSYQHLIKTASACCYAILDNRYWHASTALGSIYRLAKSVIRSYLPKSIIEKIIHITQKKKNA